VEDDVSALRTERLLLRCTLDGDLASYREVHGDPATSTCRRAGAATPQECADRVSESGHRWDDVGLDYWTVVERLTGDILGFGGLRPDNGELNMYFRFRPSAWGVRLRVRDGAGGPRLVGAAPSRRTSGDPDAAGQLGGSPTLVAAAGVGGVQHPLAMSHVELELASLMTQKAAALYDAGQAMAAGEAANMAKYAARRRRVPPSTVPCRCTAATASPPSTAWRGCWWRPGRCGSRR